MIPARNTSISALSVNFGKKFKLFWNEIVFKYPNAVVFETHRTLERQKYLYAQGRYKPYQNNVVISWTMESMHLTGDAVDIVFRNNGKLEWKGPYLDLIEMAKKYGIRNLAPRELCHFEDDGSKFSDPIEHSYAEIRLADVALEGYSSLYDGSKDPRVHEVTSRANKELRIIYGFKPI